MLEKLACVIEDKSHFMPNVFKVYQKDPNLSSQRAQGAIIFGKLITDLRECLLKQINQE